MSYQLNVSVHSLTLSLESSTLLRYTKCQSRPHLAFAGFQRHKSHRGQASACLLLLHYQLVSCFSVSMQVWRGSEHSSTLSSISSWDLTIPESLSSKGCQGLLHCLELLLLSSPCVQYKHFSCIPGQEQQLDKF